MLARHGGAPFLQMHGMHAMGQRDGTGEPLPAPGLDGPVASTAAGDAWARLAAFVASAEVDPQLRNLLEETIASQHTLRSVAILIATRYRSLIDAVPDAVTIHDESGRIVDVNAAACTIYGYEREALKKLSVHDLNPGLPADHMQRVLATFRLGNTYTIETINRRGDGTGFPVEVHSNAYLDGHEKRIVAIARDISARNRADLELRASESRFRLLVQSMDKGVVVMEESGRILSCNPAACRILGMSEADLCATMPEQFAATPLLDDKGRPLATEELPAMRAFRTGRTVNSTLIGIYLKHLGTQRWLSVTSVPQFVRGRTRPFQVVSTFDDVTAMKRESEMFAQTQALARIGGWQYGFDDGSLLWTSQIHVIFDLPEASGISLERMAACLPGEDRTRFHDAIAAVRGGQPVECELRMISTIGRRRWVRIVARPVLHHDKVTALSGTLQDITERKLIEDSLRRKAMTDPLTGLPNRDALVEAATAAIAETRGADGPALLHLNLDRFRAVNDLLGYGAGDNLLAVFARRLREGLPDEWICARIGGDEFMVLLPTGSTDEQCRRAAEQLTTTFAEPFRIDEQETRLTLSAGLARHPDDGATLDQLFSHASAAMVEAKRRGRNLWQRFTPALARRASHRLRIESQLRRALDALEFRLEFQPQIDLGSRRVRSAEALLRWTSRELGEIPPDVFVPYAEANGDIVAIGEWAIRESCRQLREWRDGGLDIGHVAVNVSYRQLLSGSLAQSVLAALRDYDLPGEALELELTERVLIEDLSDSQQTFSILQGLGVKMVIDDFGEGYSALGYLRRLPIEGLKISHGFMQHVPGVPPDTAICEAIIRIGQSLGLVVIAEGVENEQQLEFLASRGARLAQGYLFSRPLRADDFASWTRTHNRQVGLRASPQAG